jgi:hypothetical protein
MELKKSVFALGMLWALAGCIESSSDDETEEGGSNGEGADRISFTGLVADGYLDGATVCLDLNENKECDTDEPTATSGAGGVFEITDATQAQREGFPLLVEVVVGTTIDEDNEGVALTKPLTLTAPVGYSFVSPLSTMVQNEVEGGATSAAAEVAVQDKLGTSLSLDEDYIAAQDSGDFTEAEQAEFEQLHQVAQVTARVISDNMETLEEAAEENNISLDDLISAIVDEVFDALDEITTQVEVIAADDEQVFDPDALAEDVNEELVDLEPETINEQVEQNKAEEEAVATSLAVVVKAGGLSWFWAEMEFNGSEHVLAADHGTISLDASDVFIDESYIWNGNAFVLDANATSEDTAYILNGTDWVELSGGDEASNLIANEDGSISLRYGTDLVGYNEKISGVEVNISGLNKRVVMNGVEDGDGIWGDYLLDTAVFPAGSIGYQLSDAGSDEPYLFEDWDDCSEMVGGLCNFAYVQNGSGLTNGQGTSFADITSATAYTLTDGSITDIQEVLGTEIAYYDNGDKVWAEIVTGGVVNYYRVTHGHTAITLLGSATWASVAGTSNAIELQPIAAISVLDSEFDGGGNPVLALLNGFVRIAAHDLAGGDDSSGVQLLNTVARDSVIGAHFSLDNVGTTPEQTEPVAEAFNAGTLAGVYVWGVNEDEGKGDATFTFNADGTGFVHWPPEPDETDPNHPGYNDTLAWAVDAEGRLLVDLIDSEGVNQEGYDRYSITAGVQGLGSVQLETCDDATDACEVAHTYTWITAANSSMADLVGVYDDHGYDSQGSIEDMYYIEFVDNEDGIGELINYDYQIDDFGNGQDCSIINTLEITDNDDGTFHVTGFEDQSDGGGALDVTLRWYRENNNLHDDEGTVAISVNPTSNYAVDCSTL